MTSTLLTSHVFKGTYLSSARIILQLMGGTESLIEAGIFCGAAQSHTTMSCVSVAHQSLAGAVAAASWRVSMNLKALSTPGDKAALFVCGALHPATKAFRMLRAPSLSLSSLAITSPPTTLHLNTFLHLTLGIAGDDIERVSLCH